MMEVVRACLRAGEIAGVAEFFSFGTNDLTQATFSFSRGTPRTSSCPSTTPPRSQGQSVRSAGYGGRRSVDAVRGRNGRKTRGGLKVGICGEQGGHPASMRFCHYANLTYVSCSSPSGAGARLAAARQVAGRGVQAGHNRLRTSGTASGGAALFGKLGGAGRPFS